MEVIFDFPPHVFHPGHFPKKSMREQRAERKKKRKLKKLKKPKATVDSNLNTLSTFSFNKPPHPIAWVPASFSNIIMGAWRIQFEIEGWGGTKGLISRIRNNYNLYVNNRKCEKNSWSPPKCIEDLMLRQKQEDKFMWNKLLILAKLWETKIGPRLQRFLRMWIIKRSLRNLKNQEDIVTMETPKKPVYIVDIEKRCSYVFEASTLKNAMERRFMISDFMFADPQSPVNPLTNEVLTTGQCFSVINQMCNHGVFSWALDRYRAGGCNMVKFERNFRQYLKLKAIKFHFTNQVDDSIETVCDYFECQAEDAEMPDIRIKRFTTFLMNNKTHKFTKDWLKITQQYYMARELQENIALVLIAKKTQTLLQKSYYYSASPI